MTRDEFIAQLRALGFDVRQEKEPLYSFAYTVPSGRFAGQQVRIALQLAGDVHFNPPPGPHVSPRLLPQKPTAGVHPNDGVHESPLGPDWQYWSRPFPNWTKTDRSARAYMSHINTLFDTQ